jgi:exodeoxyribonuclease V beta subunit
MNGLIKWLGEQRHPETPRLDEHQLRLESDEKAVTIITMHKCKGLEYPIVFCPFGWEGSIVQKDAVFFHEQEEGQQLALDLDVAARPQHRHLAERERLAENLRLLYVALTRAKVRCYLAWGNIQGSETSAMAYLFHSGKAIKGSDRGILSDLKSIVSKKTEDERIQDMEALARRSRGTICFKPMPEARETPLLTIAKGSETLSHRRFSGQIRSPWKITSFSSLISQKTADIELPDFDSDFESIKNSHDAKDIFAFPRGSRAGQFFHHLFETLDFQLPAHRQKEWIVQKLSEFGFSSDWGTVVATQADHLLQTPLSAHPEPVVLSDIPSKDRVHEMEFHFPLNRISPNVLNHVFSRYGSGRHMSGYPEQLGRLIFSTVEGFMKGFIDLVCCLHGKYFLIDWKSNFLGSHLEDYGQKELTKVMNMDHYLLQYHLYVLAFHQYLKLRIPSYCYQSDFGGVYYLFIRGIDPKHGSKYGVFYDLPDWSLIEALGTSLIPSFSG